MSNQVYTDNRKTIYKLVNDSLYRQLVEIYRDGRQVAALFEEVLPDGSATS